MVLAVIISVMVLIFLASFVVAPRLLRRTLLGSKAKQKQAKQLLATGAKGRATVLSVQPTGTVVNNIYIQVTMGFRVDPLADGPVFEGAKTAYIPQPQLPRVGDQWPCWFDASDTTIFTVALPKLDEEEAQVVLREFGIANPLDPASPAGELSMVDALERLSALRDSGALNEAQFEAAKEQLLRV